MELFAAFMLSVGMGYHAASALSRFMRPDGEPPLTMLGLMHAGIAAMYVTAVVGTSQ